MPDGRRDPDPAIMTILSGVQSLTEDVREVRADVRAVRNDYGNVKDSLATFHTEFRTHATENRAERDATERRIFALELLNEAEENKKAEKQKSDEQHRRNVNLGMFTTLLICLATMVAAFAHH